ncbi:MAG TPA: conjugal transfer protein TrbF [Rhizomicrobium sp.]|jgi:type IV secretion system protein VirB5
MFARATTRYGTTPEPVTPYQKGVQAWDDRIGSSQVQARNWRLGFFGMLLLSGGLAAGLVWQSARGTIVPWVVQVDRLGQVQATGPATADYRPTDPIIARDLATFIWNVRTISPDGAIDRHDWLQAYSFVTDKGHAALDAYARADDPFAKIKDEQVEADVESVVRASADTFQVTWTERHFKDGGLSATEHWRAFLTVLIAPPTDKDKFKVNPLGIWVDAINWSKEYTP